MNHSVNATTNNHIHGVVATKQHLDKQFEIECNQDILKELKVDVIMMHNSSQQGKTLLNTVRINSVFLYYLAYVMVGLAISRVM